MAFRGKALTRRLVEVQRSKAEDGPGGDTPYRDTPGSPAERKGEETKRPSCLPEHGRGA